MDVEHAILVRYPVKLYADYFKCALVRNPWDRLVSCWLNKIVSGQGVIYNFTASDVQKMMQIENFVEWVSSLDITKCDRHLISQCALIDLNKIELHRAAGNLQARLCAGLQKTGHSLPRYRFHKRNESETLRGILHGQVAR